MAGHVAMIGWMAMLHRRMNDITLSDRGINVYKDTWRDYLIMVFFVKQHFLVPKDIQTMSSPPGGCFVHHKKNSACFHEIASATFATVSNI
jgi:hypothetical protein